MPRHPSAVRRACAVLACAGVLLVAACEEDPFAPPASTTTTTTLPFLPEDPPPVPDDQDGDDQAGPPAETTTTTTGAPPLPSTTVPPATTTTTAAPSTTTTTSPAHAGHGMPVVDTSAIPTGSSGHSTIRVRDRNDSLGQVGRGDDGAFRNVCDFSHMNFDDPLVFPGQRDATHLHAFFGNTGVDHRSTASSIMTTGNSTCRGGIINRSAYWVPAIIDTRNGAPVRPRDMIVYYKSGYAHEPHEIQPHPAGLRMIAGDPRSTAPQNRVWYRCGESGRDQRHIPAGCPGNETVTMSIEFPQCWNGRDLDSADHRSHMAYPGGQGCPSSHPVPLPVITFNVNFPVAGGDTSAWRLSSDMYPTSQPGGYSGHADWWDGWVEEFKQEWVRGCTAVYASCHAHLLGPGREIY